MKITKLVAAILLLYLSIFSLTAYADDTELAITVPTEHTVQLFIQGHGKVSINGITYSSNSVIPVKRFSTLEVKAFPAENSALNLATFKNTNVTDLVTDSVFLSEKITNDVTLSVSFIDIQNILPQTGNIYHILSSLIFLASIICIVVVLFVF